MVDEAVARLVDVSVRYSSGATHVDALSEVSLDVFPGTSTSIVGRSGSGKSTLMGILSGLRSPTSGAVTLPAEVTSTPGSVGVVFQSFHLDAHLTPLENAMLPWFVLGGMSRRAARTNAELLLERVGLNPKVGRATAKMSGGERQRVAIARALFYSPKLLVADEPTGNLDEATSVEIQGLLFREPRERPDCAVVVVTHDRQFAAVADEIVELSAGRIVASRHEVKHP